MVDIIPSSQLVIGHGAFSIVYRARLKHVRGFVFCINMTNSNLEVETYRYSAGGPQYHHRGPSDGLGTPSSPPPDHSPPCWCRTRRSPAPPGSPPSPPGGSVTTPRASSLWTDQDYTCGASLYVMSPQYSWGGNYYFMTAIDIIIITIIIIIMLLWKLYWYNKSLSGNSA